MNEVTAGRTLVKSAPELWAVCSDADKLAQHLEPFGEIRITRLEPETTVAWEGERASGTVRIEPSGWGTKVTVTAAETESEVASQPAEPGIESEPRAATQPNAEPEVERKAEAEAEPKAETHPKAETQPEAETQPNAETQPEAATRPEAETKPEVDTKPESVPESETEAIREPEHAVPEPARRPGFFARLFGRRQAPASPTIETESVAPRPESGDTEAGSEVGEAERDAVSVPDAQSRAPEPEVASAGPGPTMASAAEPVAEQRPPLDTAAALEAALDSLGQAHRRPFSR